MERLQRFCFAGINGVFALWMLTVCLLMGLNIASYYYNVVNFRPLYYLLFAVLAAAVTFSGMALCRKSAKLSAFLRKNPEKIMLCSVLLLFCVQAAFLSIAYVPLGWDVTEIIEMASGQSLFANYFIRYPNNTVMTACFKVLFQFTNKFGMDCWLAAILLSALATDVALVLICRTVQKVFGLKAFYLTLWLSVLLYALHPTVSTPYSDTLVMPFTAAFVYFGAKFMLAHTRREKCRFGFICGFVLYFGYCIKPTVMIAGIASVILLFLCLKKPTKAQFTSALLCILFCTSGILTACTLSTASNAVVFGRVPTEEERYEKEFPMSHFFMMGLNERSDAYYGFFRADVNTTASITGKNEKTEFHKSIIRVRLKNMGASGFLQHCLNKAIWVSTDGTFYYGGEGEFHNGNEKAESGLRGVLQNYLYTETPFYTQFLANAMQGVWLFVSVGVLLACLRRQKFATAPQNKLRFFLQLSLLGLLLFLMLFEARSRYLFLYLPYFAALAAIGFSQKRSKARKRKSQKAKSISEKE